MILPAWEGSQVVLTDDEDEIVLGVLLLDDCERIDSVAGPRHVKLHIKGFETIIVADGQFHHVESVKLVQEVVVFLERVLRGNHEPDLVNFRAFHHGVRDDEVPDVYRVEGAEKESDLHLIGSEALHQPFCLGDGVPQVIVDEHYIELVLEAHLEFGLEEPARDAVLRVGGPGLEAGLQHI